MSPILWLGLIAVAGALHSGFSHVTHFISELAASGTLGSGVVALVSLLFMSWSGNPVNAPGLFEHLATGVLSIWLLVFAVRVVRVGDDDAGRRGVGVETR